MKFSKECCFEHAATMVICLEALEDFIETFEQKCPKLMHGTKVPNTIWCVDAVMMVGPHNIGTIQLEENQYSAGLDIRRCRTEMSSVQYAESKDLAVLMSVLEISRLRRRRRAMHNFMKFDGLSGWRQVLLFNGWRL